MKISFLKRSTLLAATLFLSQMCLVAQAQPDLEEMPKGDNPPARERGGKARKFADEAIRKMLTQAGVEDVAKQDTVLTYVREDMEARRPMREQGAKLFQALREGAVTDDQLLALVTDYRAAQEAEQVRREKAQEELDEKIKFSENPRLEAMLLLAGLIGDGALMNGAQMGKGAMAQGEKALKREEDRKKAMEIFDKNADGKLDRDERKLWREERQAQRADRKGQREKNIEQQPPVAIDEAPADVAVAGDMGA